MEARLAESQRWIARLRQVTTQSRTYLRGHPAVETGIDELYVLLTIFGKSHGLLRYFMKHDEIYSKHGYEFADTGKIPLFGALVADGVDAISFAPGITREDVGGLVDLLSIPPDQLRLPASVMLWRLRSAHIRYRLNSDFVTNVLSRSAMGHDDEPSVECYARCLRALGPVRTPSTRQFLARRDAIQLAKLGLNPEVALSNLQAADFDWQSLVLTEFERDQVREEYANDDPDARLSAFLEQVGGKI
jgi:hypothetical protein